MNFERASGILLHPTSLPGGYGIGDLGPAAYSFIDFLVDSRQSYWQILPLGPTGYGDSPYQCFSAFAGNTLLISPEKLVGDSLVDESELTRHAFNHERVDFGGVYGWKATLLATASDRFNRDDSGDLRGDFETFCEEHSGWLGDYALYRAVKAANGQKAWYEWPDPLKLREPGALSLISDELSEEIDAQKFYQFLFFRQWLAVKEYANRKGVKIIGDIPIFVALDSSDVWCNQDKFKLNSDGSANVVAGVPPDYFSKTGQLWGNPIYDWDAMAADGFGWWIERFRHTLKMVDVVRIDHFRGFAASWEVPGGDRTAENGAWVKVPGHELFSTLRQTLGDFPVIAEDLGVITPDVEELRDSFEFPGMRILQYAFSGDAKNRDLPHNYIRNCIAYTGTHDNETSLSWFQSRRGHEREFSLRYLGSDGDEIHWDLVHAAWSSIADLAIAPLQDVLGLGAEGRMNLPATHAGNWDWRYVNGSLTEELATKLRVMTETYGRAV